MAKRCYPGEKRIVVKYGVVRNRAHDGGWRPVYVVNRGPVHGYTYGRGLDHADALREARAMANEEAGRFRGDYCVTVRQTVRVP